MFTPVPPSGALVILALVIGSFGVTFLVTRFAPEAKGHGVPEVIDATYYRRGRIRVDQTNQGLSSSIALIARMTLHQSSSKNHRGLRRPTQAVACDRITPILPSPLCEDGRDMCLNSIERNPKLFGNLLVCHALGKQMEDLLLPWSKQIGTVIHAGTVQRDN